jgi:hypothetical protein
MKRVLCGGAPAIGLVLIGCASIDDSPMVLSHLKTISAGHTGCLPDENEIDNVSYSPSSSSIWNATCRGKVYVCSAVASGSKSESSTCTPDAK